MKIDFEKYKDEIFNPLIYDLQEAKTRWVINYGGAGSGKSYTQTQHEIIERLEKPAITLVVRKYSVTLKDSVINLFTTVLKDWKISYRENKTDRTITFNNGSVILFKGLDDPEKIKSIAGIRRVWVEEASELEPEDMEQLNLRLRGAKNLQITLTFNPISDQHFIKKRFFDRKDKDVTHIHTTYRNNKFIDEGYKAELEKYKLWDYNYYKIYALGQWGKLHTGAEFYKNFKAETNTQKINYNPELPLHISFDENVNPYLPCTVWQGEGAKLWQVDEITMESPRNNIQHICTEISKKYRNHNAGMFIYGDATSKKSDVKIEKGYDFFKLVRRYLEKYKPVTRVPKANPSVMMRGMFINATFAGQTKAEIIVNSKCDKTINDLQEVIESADGTKEKKKIKDSKSGVTYEPYGHLSDTLDYIVTVYFKDEYNDFQGRGVNSKPMTYSRESLSF